MAILDAKQDNVHMNDRFMKIIKWLLFVSLVSFFAGCGKGERQIDASVLTFFQNVRTEVPADTICVLDESVDPIGVIAGFAMVNDSTFVVVDNRSVCMYDIKGNRKKTALSRGRGKGELISPNAVCVSKQYIYVWCSSLLKLVAMTHDGKFHAEYGGFDRAIKKMTVVNDEHLYMYTSGNLKDTEDIAENTIRIYDLKEGKSILSFGERTAEDIVMYIVSGSGAIDYNDGNLLYANSGNPRIFVRNMSEDTEKVYQIDDPQFNMELVENSKDFTDNINEWVRFADRNAVVRDIFSDNGKIYLIAEIGAYDRESRSVGTRKIKVYELGSDFTPLKSMVYDKFYSVSGLDIQDGSLLFLHMNIEKGIDGGSIQNIYLMSLPLD